MAIGGGLTIPVLRKTRGDATILCHLGAKAMLSIRPTLCVSPLDCVHAHRRVKAFQCNLSHIKKRVKVCLTFISNNLRNYDLVGFSACTQSRRKLYRTAE